MTSNAELFAQAVNEALAPQDTPPPTTETPTPRRPAPVPEIGAARAPQDHDAVRRAMFADIFSQITNR